MGDDLTLEILFFALIAAFLCHRLWLVLGRRDGAAPPARPDPFTAVKPEALAKPRDILPMAIADQTTAVPMNDDPLSLEGSLSRLRAVDPAFDEKQFLGGAKTAFQMIVKAFSEGDRTSLKPLLSEDVYRSFDQAITARDQGSSGLKVLKVDAAIEAVRLTGSVARITVGFRSTQVNIPREADGAVSEGDAKRTEDVADVWTFARSTSTNDPNWTLVETRHTA